MATTRLRDTARTFEDSLERLSAATSDAEALSRAAESLNNVLAGRASRASDSSGFDKRLKEAEKASKDANAKVDELRARDAKLDLSGTRASLSDSEGNFAPNARVARAGGIGVAASNTGPSGDQAGDVDEVVAGAEAQGSTMTGGPAVFGPGGVAIDPATGEALAKSTAAPAVVEGASVVNEEDTSSKKKRRKGKR